ncbi:hypothetical protein U1Q18_032748 [Sarracenia purpurea var. burkii]
MVEGSVEAKHEFSVPLVPPGLVATKYGEAMLHFVGLAQGHQSSIKLDKNVNDSLPPFLEGETEVKEILGVAVVAKIQGINTKAMVSISKDEDGASEGEVAEEEGSADEESIDEGSSDDCEGTIGEEEDNSEDRAEAPVLTSTKLP